MQYKDYYDTLSLARDASPEEVKRAYRKLARKFHPDVSEEANAEERFKEVQEAYEVLKDPEKREAYDRLGANWHAGEDFAPPPDWHTASAFHGDGTGGERGFSDFFASIFGDSGPRRRGAPGGFQMRGQDLNVKVEIALEDAYHGRSRGFTFAIPELDAHGEVRRSQKTVNVAIPKGVVEGQRIRLGGQGGAGFGGGPPGDLLLEIAFAPHDYLHAEGRDIYLDLPLAPWEAALGGKVKAPTLGGTVEVNVPPGSQSDRRLRLQGRGLPGKPAGDQYVVLKVVVPVPVNEEQIALYREMARSMPFDPRSMLKV